MKLRFTALFLITLLALIGQAAAQESTEPVAPTVFDLRIGDHAAELPKDSFTAFACGTNGGPPSLPLVDWTGYDLCRPEPVTAFHEVYFEYDNELELWARAHDLPTRAAFYEYTSVYGIPVITSVLLDERGFIAGLRLVTDPRVTDAIRELGITLGGFLRARYGVDGWSCLDLPRLEGESSFRGFYEKRRCEMLDGENPHRLVLETHNYRKPGQHALDPGGLQLTEGQFRSETRLEVLLVDPIEDAEARLAEILAREVESTDKEVRILQALDCPGCDFAGADFKRANLAGANLAGANLAGANLHEAILRGANLAGANLNGANLNGVDAKLADLVGATLREAMMYAAAFDGADLSGADLSGALAGHSTMPRASLANAVAITTDFIHARLNDADFTGADLRGSRFSFAQLTRSNFTRALLTQSQLQQVNLRRAILVEADVRGANLFRADLREADLTAADFTLARLRYATVSGAVVNDAIWTDAELPIGLDLD